MMPGFGMMSWGLGGLGMAMGGLFTLVWWGLIILGVVLVVRWLRKDAWPRAREKILDQPGGARFAVMDAEDLAFKDGTFDRVVATCVFCSIPDPVRGLREIRRVLRPGGEAIFLEHMRPGGARGGLFDLLDPVVSRMMGPHINRRTLDNMREAGLRIEEERNVHSDWVKVVVTR